MICGNRNKYYTPSIEEFHVGFRYQSHVDPRTYNGWDDKEVDRHSIVYPLKVDSDVDYRVKYLNRDDIEELGWKYKGKHWYYYRDEYYEINVDEYLSFYLHKHLNSGIESGQYTIIQAEPGGYSLEGGHYKFDGEIRNYNELKFQMERLNIKSKDE
jgi:hypothetical protein